MVFSWTRFFCFLMLSTDLGNTASASRTCLCQCAAIPMKTSASRKLTWLPASMGGLKTGPCDLWLRFSGKVFPLLKQSHDFSPSLNIVVTRSECITPVAPSPPAWGWWSTKPEVQKDVVLNLSCKNLALASQFLYWLIQFVSGFLEVSELLKCYSFPLANWPASSSC